jgi:4-carboxymuconolactone decarboxylase
MADSEAFRAGQAMRRDLMGEEFVDQVNAGPYADPIMQQFRDLTTETVFGLIWTRPGLDHRTRTLISVVSDASTGRLAELPLHLRMARRQGWSEDELVEALLHLTGYVGAPMIRESLFAARDTFAELRAEQ